MIKVFKLLILLIFTLPLLGQTNYISMIEVENQPYGIHSGLFNGSTTDLTLTSVEVSGAISQVCVSGTCHTYSIEDGLLVIGLALDNAEELNCQSVIGTTLSASPSAAPSDGVRLQQQPCSPHNLPYGGPYTGPGNCGGFNYTCLTTLSLKRCWGLGEINSCVITFTKDNPLVLHPGQGVSVWTGRYQNNNSFSYQGYITATYRWNH